jgi:hypothetical protein
MKKTIIKKTVVIEHYEFSSYAERESWCTDNMHRSPWVLGVHNDLFIELEEDGE